MSIFTRQNFHPPHRYTNHKFILCMHPKSMDVCAHSITIINMESVIGILKSEVYLPEAGCDTESFLHGEHCVYENVCIWDKDKNFYISFRKLVLE